MLVLRDNRQRAHQIILIFWVLIIFNVASIASYLWQYELLIGARDFPDQIDIEILEMNDTVRMTVSIAYVVVAILTIIYFIRWFRRAYYNLHQLPSANPEFTEGWAAGSWFIPILNLFRPYQIMREIWTGKQEILSHRNGAQESTALIGSWWALHLISHFYANVSLRYTNNAESIPDMIGATQVELVGDVITLAAAIITIVVVRKASGFEQQLQEEVNMPNESIFHVS